MRWLEPLSLTARLYDLGRRQQWLWGGEHHAHMVALLRELSPAEGRDALPCAVYFLFHRNAEVQRAAGEAISTLVRQLPLGELLHVGEQFLWDYYWLGGDLWRQLQPREVAALAGSPQPNAEVLGVLSFHRNGYVRQAAVRQLAEVHDGNELPFLLIRQNDHVQSVALEAQSAVRRRLRQESLPQISRNLALILHLESASRRHHGEMIRTTVDLLLRPENDEHLKSALDSPQPAVRRRMAQLALECAAESLPRVMAHAAASADPLVRLQAAQRLLQVPSETDFARLAALLKHDRSMPARRAALVALAARCPERGEAIWKAALFDRSRSIRELARCEIRPWQLDDAAPVYRAALAHNPADFLALEGLAETATAADKPLFQSLLQHPVPSRRSIAIEGLAHANADCLLELVLPKIADESPAVVRAAWRALHSACALVPCQFLLETALTAPHPFARRTAVRQLAELGKWRSLPWLIQAAVKADTETAQVAEEMILQWCSSPKCNRMFLLPTETERREIADLVAAFNKSLSDRLRQVLDEELRRQR